MHAAFIAAALVVMLSTACGDSSGPSTVIDVEIRDGNTFSPPTVNISRGTTVRWRNLDDVQHNSVSTAATAWNSGTLDPNDSFSQRFNNAGSFPYQCTFHPGMTGTVNVGLN